MFNVNLKLSSESNAIFLVRPLNLKLFRTLELTLEEGMTCFRWSDESGYYSNHHELLRVNERILRAINFELCHRCDQIRTTGCHGPGVLSADPAANGKSPPSFQWRQWHGGENTIKKTKKKERETRARKRMPDTATPQPPPPTKDIPVAQVPGWISTGNATIREISSVKDW